jgi:hypothetical protein
MSFISGTSGTLQHHDDEHLHSAQLVAPSGAPIAVVSGVGVYVLGAFSADFIIAGAVPLPFDLHWVDISNIGANDDYEIVFYYGPTDIEACRAAFTRSGPQVVSFQIHLQTIILPAGSRIRAKMRSAAGGNTCNAKIFYHEYV